MKKSISFIKGTWMHLLLRGEIDNEFWESFAELHKKYVEKNGKEPDGYFMEVDNNEN